MILEFSKIKGEPSSEKIAILIGEGYIAYEKREFAETDALNLVHLDISLICFDLRLHILR